MLLKSWISGRKRDIRGERERVVEYDGQSNENWTWIFVFSEVLHGFDKMAKAIIIKHQLCPYSLSTFTQSHTHAHTCMYGIFWASDAALLNHKNGRMWKIISQWMNYITHWRIQRGIHAFIFNVTQYICVCASMSIVYPHDMAVEMKLGTHAFARTIPFIVNVCSQIHMNEFCPLRKRQEQSFSNAYKCVRHYDQTVEKQSVFEIKATNTDNKCVKKIVSACACVCVCLCPKPKILKVKRFLNHVYGIIHIFKMSNEEDKWAIMSVKLDSLTEMCVCAFRKRAVAFVLSTIFTHWFWWIGVW